MLDRLHAKALAIVFCDSPLPRAISRYSRGELEIGLGVVGQSTRPLAALSHSLQRVNMGGESIVFLLLSTY